MVFKCILCQKEKCYYYNLCSKCERVKDYLSLYGDRVYEVLDSVLSRDNEKQENKMAAEIKKEIEVKEDSLKKKRKKVNFVATTD